MCCIMISAGQGAGWGARAAEGKGGRGFYTTICCRRKPPSSLTAEQASFLCPEVDTSQGLPHPAVPHGARAAGPDLHLLQQSGSSPTGEIWGNSEPPFQGASPHSCIVRQAIGYIALPQPFSSLLLKSRQSQSFLSRGLSKPKSFPSPSQSPDWLHF